MNVLIDTNILLDVIQERAPYDKAATRVWKLAEEEVFAGYVSAISFNNIFYIARKQMGSNRAHDAVITVRKTFKFVPLDEYVIDRALAAHAADFEDAIQAAAAIHVTADYIITRNVRDFASLGVPSLTAEEFLAVLIS